METKEKYLDLDYWREYFHKDSVIKPEYVDVSDGSKLLIVSSRPAINNSNSYPVVFISGWFSHPSGWKGTLLELSKTTPIIYLETRDKDSSILIGKKTKFDGDRLADDLIEVLEYMDLEMNTTILAGSSMGGSIIMNYLIKRPGVGSQPVISVLVGPNPHFEIPKIQGKIFLSMPVFLFRVAVHYIRWYALKFRVDAEKEPEQAARYDHSLRNVDPWKMRQGAKAIIPFNIWDQLSNIKSKVVIIADKNDKMHKAERSHRMLDLMENSSYFEFESNKQVHSEPFGAFLARLAHGETIEEITKEN